MEEPSPGQLAPGWMTLEFTRTKIGGERSQVRHLFCPECGAEMVKRLAGPPPWEPIPKREFPNDPKPAPREEKPRRPWESG